MTHHLFERGGIVPITGKELITQRHGAAADYQRDIDLLTVRPVVARVATQG